MIDKKIANQYYDTNCELYRAFSKKMHEYMNDLIHCHNINIHSSTYRLKSKESFIKKCTKDKYNEIADIHDLAGIRIITFITSDIDTIIEIIKKEFIVDSIDDKRKGYNINEVGYLSTHMIIRLNKKRLQLTENKNYNDCKCEIQLRTVLQHAWAEISHDRSYKKFSGKLSDEMTRRLNIVSGTLELVDREFQSVAEAYDKYSKQIQEITKKGELDIQIDSISLLEYLKKVVNLKLKIVRDFDANFITELNNFGISTIKDVDNLLFENGKLKYGTTKNTNYFSLLRDYMIITDYKKYFDKAWNNNWQGTDFNAIKYWNKFGIPKDIYKTYGFDIDRIPIDKEYETFEEYDDEEYDDEYEEE